MILIFLTYLLLLYIKILLYISFIKNYYNYLYNFYKILMKKVFINFLYYLKIFPLFLLIIISYL